MIVPSISFLGFAAVAALIFNLGSSVLWRQVVLLGVNIAFLASFSLNPASFVPFMGFLALGFVAQRRMRQTSSGRLFVALLVLIVLAFFWLKRYVLALNNVFPPVSYVLVGLSYVFFRVLHLVVDSHQGAIEGRIGLLSYLNYTLNFTSLTSGPIQRYQDYHHLEKERLPLDPSVIGIALERIIIGYFKIAIVSMILSVVQQQSIHTISPAQVLPSRIWQGILIAATYPIYLYFNFSGYMDVVIGVARFFRIELPENFDRPFSSENFIIFWSRWHITLSNWLKTYVYNPLMLAGLARITEPKLAPYIAVPAFFMTFFLVGLWHGQTTEFLFFGLLQGGGVAANKLYQVVLQKRLGRKQYRALAANPFYRAIARGLTFAWFALTLFWFWSNWNDINTLLHTLGLVGVLLAWLAIFAVATVVLAIMGAARGAILSVTWDSVPVVQSRYVRTAWDTALVAVTIAAIALLNSTAPDTVYKTF